jgi:hypothetical protein
VGSDPSNAVVEDVLAVPLDRLDTDHELLRDLLRGVGLGDQLQHLQFARTECPELTAGRDGGKTAFAASPA